MHCMQRRVLPDEQAFGPGHLHLDVLEDIAATGAETVLVRQPSFDIAETTQRVEVVLLVPVHRRLLPQAFEYRIRIHPELGPVRIPVDGIFGGHGVSFLAWFGDNRRGSSLLLRQAHYEAFQLLSDFDLTGQTAVWLRV